MRRVLAVLAVAATSVMACGGDAPPVSEAAAIELAERVEQVRAGATAGDADAARAGLADVRATVDRLRARGELTEQAATLILAASADVEDGLALITTTTAPTTTTTAPPPPPTTARDDEDDDEDEKEDDEDKGRGGDRGRGKDKEDD